jgi:hypothetical protein
LLLQPTNQNWFEIANLDSNFYVRLFLVADFLRSCFTRASVANEYQIEDSDVFPSALRHVARGAKNNLCICRPREGTGKWLGIPTRSESRNVEWAAAGHDVFSAFRVASDKYCIRPKAAVVVHSECGHIRTPGVCGVNEH